MSLTDRKVAVIGLGYVGLPLLVEISKKYICVGFDIDNERINELRNNYDRTSEISENDLKKLEKSLTSNAQEIRDCSIKIITVPTPINEQRQPNLEPILSATEIVAENIKKNDIVIYESTVYPGLTEDICMPLIEQKSKLKYNKDFFCGYSPERVNPGDTERKINNIIKITSGSNDEIALIVDDFYRSIISAGTYKASSIKVAEAAKVIENIQRDVNIALINEFSMIFDKIGINTKKVLEAASTKWNFNRFDPGLVGGHCIGVDPYYLSYKAIELGIQPEMILAGRKINEKMTSHISNYIISKLIELGKNPINAKICILGLSFKENCPDLRNTKIIDLYNQLINFKCHVQISDSIVSKSEVKKKYDIELVDLETIEKKDVVILAVAHDTYKSISPKEIIELSRENGIFVDIKSVFNKKDFENSEVHYWSL